MQESDSEFDGKIRQGKKIQETKKHSSRAKTDEKKEWKKGSASELEQEYDEKVRFHANDDIE